MAVLGLGAFIASSAHAAGEYTAQETGETRFAILGPGVESGVVAYCLEQSFAMPPTTADSNLTYTRVPGSSYASLTGAQKAKIATILYNGYSMDKGVSRRRA